MSNDDIIFISESILYEDNFDQLLKVVLELSIIYTNSKKACIYLNEKSKFECKMIGNLNKNNIISFKESSEIILYNKLDFPVSQFMIFQNKYIGIICINNDNLSEEEINNLKYISSISALAIHDFNKKHEEYLLNQKKIEEIYKIFFDTIPIGIVIHKNGTIIYGNQLTLELFNIKDINDIVGKNLMNVIHPESYNIVLKRMNHIDSGGVSTPFMENKIINFDKNIIEVESASINIPYKGDDVVLVVFTDITERKEIEYDKIKTEFIINISHELKTPINVILSTLQLFELKMITSKNEEKEKYIGYVRTMKQNCYRLTRLINNLIDITKIDSGYLYINLRNCNIVNIIESTTLSVAEYVESKGLQLVFDTDVEEKIMACDPEQIERILLNLISNSVKFTKPGGIIKVLILDKDDSILVSVEDTGIGIPKERQEEIFQRFVQVKGHFKGDQGGSGIGLCLVKSLVELHGGNIIVISEEGEGSKFIMEFPVVLISDKDNSNKTYLDQNNIENIDIEFSDIYF